MLDMPDYFQSLPSVPSLPSLPFYRIYFEGDCAVFYISTDLVPRKLRPINPKKCHRKTLHGFPENGVFTVHVISFHCFALSMGNLMIHWWKIRGFSPPGLAGAGALRSEDGRLNSWGCRMHNIGRTFQCFYTHLKNAKNPPR